MADTIAYTIMGFDANSGVITLSFSGQTRTLALPIVDGNYIVGDQLESYIQENLVIFTTPVPPLPKGNNAADIQSLVVVPPSAPAPTIDTNRIRVLRNKMLGCCDYAVMPDSPLSAELKTAWITYRQQLRDLTKQTGFPTTITWPIPPSALYDRSNTLFADTDGQPKEDILKRYSVVV